MRQFAIIRIWRSSNCLRWVMSSMVTEMAVASSPPRIGAMLIETGTAVPSFIHDSVSKPALSPLIASLHKAAYVLLCASETAWKTAFPATSSGAYWNIVCEPGFRFIMMHTRLAGAEHGVIGGIDDRGEPYEVPLMDLLFGGFLKDDADPGKALTL